MACGRLGNGSEARLTLFGIDLHNLNHERLGHQHLVRHFGGDVENIAGRHFVTGPAGDRFAAHLILPSSDGVYGGSTRHQRPFARDHGDDVHPGFVDFGFAIALAPDNQ